MMKHLTDTVLDAVILKLETPFDSHKLIQEVMTDYSQKYVRELFARVDSKDPIQALHMEIGRTLADYLGIKATRKVMSLNVRGKLVENQEWTTLGTLPSTGKPL